MKTPFISGANVAYSLNVADNRLVNLYAEKSDPGAVDIAALYGTPGLRPLGSVGNGPCRALHPMGPYLYMISGHELYRVGSTYNGLLLGSVTGSGPASMDDNGTQIFAACNPDGYIYNTSTAVFAQITDPDFAGASRVGYIDGYFLFIEPNSQRFWICALLDGSSVDPLDFASAEGSPDNLVSMIIDHREVWLFGDISTEVFFNSDAEDFPFTRMQGAFVEHGCAALDSVVQMDNTIYWLGKFKSGEGILWKAHGYTPARVSNHGFENALRSYPTIADATAYTRQINGHMCYVISFPTANKTWMYDAASGIFSELAYMVPSTGELIRHRSQCHAFFNGEHIVGDFENGNLYALDPDVYDDAGDAMKSIRTWRALPTGKYDGKPTFHNALEILCETGVGLVTGQGSNPEAMLRYSGDGGYNWGNEKRRSMGAIGDRGTRVRFAPLGRAYDRVYELSITDSVKRAFVGAELDIEKSV